MNSKLNPVQRTVLVNMLRAKHQDEIAKLVTRQSYHLDKIMDADTSQRIDFHRTVARTLRLEIEMKKAWFDTVLETIRESSE